VIRMAHAVLGHEAFRRGLVEYMKKHKYSNTVTTDLWTAWAQASDKPVKEIMPSWTEQMGFPLIEVKSFTIAGSSAKFSLRQSWFLASGEDHGETRTWKTPLFFGTLKEQSQRPAVMIEEATKDFEVPLSSDVNSEFVLINLGAQTPIRVLYNSEMQSRLAKAVRSGNLSVVDRATLVMDGYALAKAGKLGTDELMRLISGYAGERDYIVWDALSQVLLGLQRLLMGGAPQEVYNRYVLFAKEFAWKSWEASKLGWESSPSDGHTDGLLRGLLMKVVSRFDPNAAFLEEARRRFARYTEDPLANSTDLPDEYRVPVFQAVLRDGGRSERDQLMAAYRKLTTNIDQKQVFQSIGFTGLELKKESLTWAVSGEVKIQDFFYIMASVSASSKAGLDMMWQYLQSNFDHIHGMVKNASPSIMDAVITHSTAGYCSSEKAAEIEKFFEVHTLPLNKRTISQVLEDIRTNAKFLERTLSTDAVKAAFWDGLMTEVASFVPPVRT